MASVQDYFLGFLLDATLDRPRGRRCPRVDALRQGEPQPWVADLRQRALKRFSQADWLVFDWLRQPEQLYRLTTRPEPPFQAARLSQHSFWVFCAWAGRYPPRPAVFEMGQVLGAFLAGNHEKAYTQDLLALVDRLQEQSSPEDRAKLLAGMGRLLEGHSPRSLKGQVARRLRSALTPQDGPLLDDLIAQLSSFF